MLQQRQQPTVHRNEACRSARAGQHSFLMEESVECSSGPQARLYITITMDCSIIQTLRPHPLIFCLDLTWGLESVFFLNVFIYFWRRERERDRAWAGEEQRERETQNLKQAPGSEPSAQSPTRGSNSRTARSWPGWSRRLTDCATQAPQTCGILQKKKDKSA